MDLKKIFQNDGIKKFCSQSHQLGITLKIMLVAMSCRFDRIDLMCFSLTQWMVVPS